MDLKQIFPHLVYPEIRSNNYVLGGMLYLRFLVKPERNHDENIIRLLFGGHCNSCSVAVDRLTELKQFRFLKKANDYWMVVPERFPCMEFSIRWCPFHRAPTGFRSV